MRIISYATLFLTLAASTAIAQPVISAIVNAGSRIGQCLARLHGDSLYGSNLAAFSV